jgi:hypothetical protein
VRLLLPQPLQSKPEVVMEDMESDHAAKDRPGPGEPIREVNISTDEEDAELAYDHTHFQRDKIKRCYFHYYRGCRIIIERGATIEEFDEHASRVRAVLDA